MTIKIENEHTNLCVSDTGNFNSATKCISQTNGLPYYFATTSDKPDLQHCSTRAGAQYFVSTLLRDSNSPISTRHVVDDILRIDEPQDSEDESSLNDEFSISSYSSSILLDHDSDRRTVQFADDLVTEIRERPRTPEEDVSTLFYSYEETQRFRQEYRLEKKLKSQYNVDTSLTSLCCDTPKFISKEDPCIDDVMYSNPQKRSRHSISRVVVKHHDAFKTFYSEDSSRQSLGIFDTIPRSDAFFDNDSFWSGSITWY